jgi:hypothetical protein
MCPKIFFPCFALFYHAFRLPATAVFAVFVLKALFRAVFDKKAGEASHISCFPCIKTLYIGVSVPLSFFDDID